MKVPDIPFVQAKWDYGTTLKYGIAVHCTSNTASASAEASYCSRRPDGTSTHFFLDEIQVIQVMDTTHKAGHAGSSEGNSYGLSLEFCALDGYTRADWLKNVDFEEAGRVVAYVIANDPQYKDFKIERATVAEMKSNPKVRKFYSHNDMRLAWGGTDHTDPGPGFPWDVFFDQIHRFLEGEEDDMPYSESQMRAFPWQYAGGGLTGNDATPDGNKSALKVLDETWQASLRASQTVEEIKAALVASGGNVESAPILAAISALADVVEKLAVEVAKRPTTAEVRDALGDLFERGSEAVRG